MRLNLINTKLNLKKKINLYLGIKYIQKIIKKKTLFALTYLVLMD